MKLSTAIFIVLGLSVLLLLGATLYFVRGWLVYFGLFVLVALGLFLLGLLALSGLMATEKYLHLKIQRKMNSYNIITDGLGQSYVIHLNGSIVALTTNPKTHINGKYEPPTQDELTLQALFFQAIGKGHVPQAQLALPAPVESTPDLLPILDKAQRVLIKAASNGGKTTLLQHIASRRQGSVIVLDSQSYPNKWPDKCKVIGTGSNHQAISIALDSLVELMVKRYKEIGEGLVKENEHPKLTVIIDEWMAIVSECPNASEVIRRLLTESRKAAFSVFIGSHSERVKALGLDGRGDLRDGFLIVRVEEERGQFVATYDYGRGERPCLLPGPYEVEQIEEVEFEIRQLTTQEQKVSDMLSNGLSRSAIARALFSHAGGNQLAQVDEIIKRINT